MRLGLAPKVVEVAEAAVDEDTVAATEVVDGALGRRGLEIKTRILVSASKNLLQVRFYPSRKKGEDHGETLDQ
jgi:hypothetical protein